MQLANRLRKIENTLKASGSGKYNGYYVMVWQTEKPGIYLVQCDGTEFEGTKAEVKEYIKPYEDGGSFIVWINVLHEWAL
jgi:hypothetical protein